MYSATPFRTVLGLVLLTIWAAPLASAQSPDWPAGTVTTQETGSSDRARLDGIRTPTQRFAERAVSIVDLADYDGYGDDPLSLHTMEQILLQLRLAEEPGLRSASALPALNAIQARAQEMRLKKVVPILIADLSYDALVQNAAQRGLVREQGDRVSLLPGATLTQNVFVAAPFATRQVGPVVDFVVDRQFIFGTTATDFQIDFGDGRGFQRVSVGQRVSVQYAEEGEATIRVRSRGKEAASTFELYGFSMPAYTSFTNRSGRSYLGAPGYYDAHVLYGSGTPNVLDKPIVAVEGFDPVGMEPGHPDRFTVEDLYDFANQQGMATLLRNAGYDVVIVRFRDPTTYIQRNAFGVEDLLNWLKPQRASGYKTILIGPSMGGLVTRYALAYMDRNGYDPGVSTMFTVDTPHGGANVPLGSQHSFSFFSPHSDAAEDGQRAMDSPAARQMLIYHYRAPGARPDPLRATFRSELSNLGGHPTSVRKVALANGSGVGSLQRSTDYSYSPMDPGVLMVTAEAGSWHSSLQTSINALRDRSSGRIFYGGVRGYVVFGNTLSVTVGNADPFDGAPGGWRGTNGTIWEGLRYQAERSSAPFKNHCFIPTVSALDLPTTNVRYHVQSDPSNYTTANADGTERTAMFDAVYYPVGNEQHIYISTASRNFILGQINPALIPIVPPTPVFTVSLTKVSGGAPQQKLNYRATVSNLPSGSGSITYNWYTGPDESGPWTLMSTRTSTLTTDTYITFPSASFGLRVTATKNGQTAETVRWVYIGTTGGGGDCDEIPPFCAKTGDPVTPLGAALATGDVPTAFGLGAPSPNPTRGTATLTVSLPEAADVTVTVHDLLGREVRRALEGPHAAGVYRASMDLDGLPAGVYVCRLQAGQQVEVQRITLVR